MALTRVILLLIVLFAGATALVWALSSTPFFNKGRLKTIMKWTAIGVAALVLTVFAFLSIFSFDHAV
ncbi:hypothetical protein [Massilia sp. TN1-12]|uniref:hypothetical protein n=1 Tax=Massilia paldalensis TaxID=3377675 RepID=UPI00384F94B3